MRSTWLSLALLPLAASAVNVLVSNDDGWAEINIRQFYNALTGAGYSAIISAPAENQSGTGSSDETPTTVGSDGCEFNSCPAGSPAEGFNASMTRFNYVNSYPVTSVKYGISTLSPKFFNGKPDVVVAGPNVGSNLGLTTLLSGTVGAATEAVKEGIPGIAFSGTTGSQTAWNAPVSPYETIYAQLATKVTQTVTGSGTPYLASNIWLNVNFPASTSTTCSATSQFKFVLSRINTAVPLLTGKDVVTCGNGGRLPTETTVVDTPGCYVSISVGHADTKGDATAAEQQAVLDKLNGILTCLPS